MAGQVGKLILETGIKGFVEVQELGKGLKQIAKLADRTDKEFLKENIFKRAVDAVKNWVSRFLTKVWNRIKTFLIQGLDIALNILGIKIKAVGDGYTFRGF